MKKTTPQIEMSKYKRIKKLRGSLKGKGILKSLMRDREHERKRF